MRSSLPSCIYGQAIILCFGAGQNCASICMIALLIVLATFIWMSSVWIVLILIWFKRPWIGKSFWCCLAKCRPRLALNELGRPVPLSTLRWSRLGRNLCKLFGLWYYEILYLSFATFADVFRGSFVWWWSYRSCNSLTAMPDTGTCATHVLI